FGAPARIERRRCPATADHEEQLAEPRLDRGLRALERVIRTVEWHGHRAPDRRRIASDLAAGLVEVARRRDGLVEALDVRVPNVAVARGEPEHPLALRSDPDRRMRPLHRFWLRDRFGELIEAPLERRAWLLPEQLHRPERLVEHSHAIAGAREGQAELGELWFVPAGPHADHEPPGRDARGRERELRHAA